MALLKTNKCYFVGTLVEVKDHREVTYGDNKTAYSAKIVIKSVLEDGTESLTELQNFTSKTNKDGSLNKNYSIIANIKELLNKRVVVSGASLVGERFWAKNTNQLVPATKYSFNLIREARPTDKDTATFSFGGFVARELVEQTDADDNIVCYKMTIAQANYREDNLQMIDFVVSKDNLAAVAAIQKMYTQGTTVEVEGICSNIVTTTTKTEERAFGDPIVKVFTNTDKKLVITSGGEPVEGEGEYTVEVIQTLMDAYTRQGIEIKNKANNESGIQTAEAAPKVPSKKSALAGLI